MIADILCILRVQTRNRLVGSYRSSTGRSRVGGVAMMVLLVFAFVVLAGYAFLLGTGLCMMGLADAVPVVATAVVTLVSLFFTALKANGMLFGCKDHEMLLALPVPRAAVAATRYLGVYLSNLSTAAFVMVPIGAAMAVFAAPSWYFYPVWLLGILLLPAVPTALGIGIGIGITAVATRFRRTNLIASVLLLAFALAMVFLPQLMTSQDMEGLAAGLSPVIAATARYYPVAEWFARAANNGAAGALTLFLGLSAAVFAAAFALFARYYITLNDAVVGKAAGKRYVHTGQRSSGAVTAVFKKEWARFTSTPIYLTNMGIGVLMAVAMSVYFSFFLMRGDGVGTMLTERMTSVMMLLIPMFLGMCPPSCASLSLEGRCLWIVQSAPLSTADVMGGKVLMAASLTMPASIVCSTLFLPHMDGVLTALLYYCYSLAFCAFSAMFGAMANLMFPNFDWESETQVVKQGMNVMVGMFGGMLLGAVPFVLGMATDWPVVWILLGGAVAYAAGAAVLWWAVAGRTLLFES